MNKQNAFRRGFTLIELMIVIVILGILMGTILPRLTGAQARARDTARKADLTNISQALEVYYGDVGKYPAKDTTPCLDPDNTTTTGTTTVAKTGKETSYALASYLKGKKIPTPPNKEQKTLNTCVGQYYYKPLKSGGMDNASYVLASDLETWQLSNYFVSGTNSAAFFNSASSAQRYINKIGQNVHESAADTTKSIFIVIP